ncbi:CshA/CshB family fibrillar adhesin-related protein [Microbacterium abyssi]|uniref:CshA/CshB family fibrillar adhesin-related protein n=1 Tax=Microbacterium abyssi TaxID=2782166 RepID=UPI00188923EC|nr:CshA/CshB family fibrillar adhesin-related protein [Microbacterium sp. A18JL241]
MSIATRKRARRWGSAALAASMAFAGLTILSGQGSDSAEAAPATGVGQYASDIYWLDWSSAQNHTGSGTNNDRPYLGVQNGTYLVQNPLPGLIVTATFSDVVAAPRSGNGTREVHVTQQDPNWSELKLNGYDTGSQYSVITPNTNSSTVSFTLNFEATLNGQVIPFNVIATDGESAGPVANESITFTTNGGDWQNIDNTTRSGARMWTSPKPDGGFGTTTMGPWVTEMSTGQGMAPIGVSSNASVVDVAIDASGMQNVMIGVMLPVDHGDAPSSFGEASHLIEWTAEGDPMGAPGTADAPRVAYDWTASPYLGAVPADPDDGTLGGWTADDLDPTGTPRDEGWEQLTGEASPPRVLAGKVQDYSVEVLASPSAEGKTVAAWIDWNNSGEFETGERAAATVSGGSAPLTWSQVQAADTASLGARFRVASDPTQTAAPTGLAEDGEAEDYLLPATQTADVVKTSDPANGTEVEPGSTVTYTLTFSNSGNQALLVDYTDHLAGVLDDAAVVAGSVTVSTGLTATVNGGSLRITGSAPAQTDSQVTYQVTVNEDELGDAVLRNWVVPGTTAPPTECVPASDWCTEHPVSAVPSLVKTSDPVSGSPVVPGQSITYTVTATNTGGPAVGTVISDDLSDVLDDASFTAGSARLTIGDEAPLVLPDPTGNTLQTEPFTLPAGAAATLDYTVTVDDDTWNTTIGNTVSGSWGDQRTIDCDVCTTTHSPMGVLIQKVGESADSEIVPMNGSEWAVYVDAGGTPGAVLDADSIAQVDGATIRLQNVTAGAYWLEETRAPDGFNLLAERIPFTVAADGTVTLDSDADSRVVTVEADADTRLSTIVVADVPALELPESGGPGTATFLVTGGLLTALAAGWAVESRRRRVAAATAG